MSVDDAIDDEGFIREADRFLAGGRYSAALDLAHGRLAVRPGDPEALMVICRAWLGLDNLEEAQTALASLNKIHLRLAGLYKAMGDGCLKRGRMREALAYFQKGLAIFPDAFEGQQLSEMMSGALRTFGEEVRSETAPPEAHAVSPDFYTVTMADLYERQGHVELAVAVLEEIHRREPHNGEVAQRLGRLRAVTEEPLPDLPGEDTRPAVIDELSRWLRNIDRIRSNGNDRYDGSRA